MRTRSARILAATGVFLLTLSASGTAVADKSSEEQQGAKLEVLGEGEFTAEGLSRNTRMGDYALEINEIARTESNLTTLTYTIRNNEDSRSAFLPAILESRTYRYTPNNTFSGVTIESTDTNKRYYTLSDTDLYCLCPMDSGSAVPNPLKAGDSITLWSSFWIPPEAKKVTVKVLGFSPVEDLTIAS